jgi:hypothetical protein
VNPKLKTSKEKKVKVIPWFIALIRVEGCARIPRWD